MHLANNTLVGMMHLTTFNVLILHDQTISVMLFIWAFNFEQKRDPSNGKYIPVDVNRDIPVRVYFLMPETVSRQSLQSIVRAPALFPCEIVLRSQRRRALVEHELRDVAIPSFMTFEAGLSDSDQAMLRQTRDSLLSFRKSST